MTSVLPVDLLNFTGGWWCCRLLVLKNVGAVGVGDEA